MGRFDKDPETGRPAFMGDRPLNLTPNGKVKNQFEAATLPPDKRALINEGRPPSTRVDVNPEEKWCGARTPGGKSKTCRRTKGEGTKHPGIGYCFAHGGNTPAANKSAARTLGRQIIQERKALLSTIEPDHPDVIRFGGNRYITNVSAEEALLEEVRRSVAMVRWLEEKIGEWEVVEPSADSPTGNTLPALVGETSRGAASDTDTAAWLLLYREERAHMVRTSKMAIDAGIAERMVRIAEDQGRLLATAVRRILDALGLSPQQAALVPQVVPTILRELSSTPLPPSPEPSPEPSPASPPLPALLAPVASPKPREMQRRK